MSKKYDIKIKFWGVRGSYPVVNRNFLEYGGNTACVEVEIGGHTIILDGGTGIIPLGECIFKEHISSADNVFDRTPMNITLLLSHIHQDHIQGLNFFKPMSVITTNLSIFGYSGFESTLSETLSELIYGKSFPINLYDVTAKYSMTDITETDIVILNKGSEIPVIKRITSIKDIIPKKDEIIISFLKSNSHPNFGVMCFKIAYKNKSVVYATDNEGYYGGSKRIELFAKDADLLIHDTQYTKEDYLSVALPKQGYGHSTFDMAIETAKAANVKQLACFHFEPSYNDIKLNQIENQLKKKNKNYFLAKEGMEICI